MTPARVIGAGLSGLTAAWWLADAGYDVDVFDAAPSAGGLIRTVRATHGIVETGANAFVWTDDVAAWFERLELEPVFASETSRRRYIFRHGRPRRWPLGIGETALLVARLAVARLARRHRPIGHESVRAWSDRVLGRAATRWLVAPALQGIFASPPEQLLASLVVPSGRPGARRLAAPAGGMGAFAERLHARLVDRGVRVCLGRRVDALDPSVVTVVATGVRGAATLVRPVAPELGRALSDVDTRSLLTATAFFEPDDRDVRGFGVLFPRGEGVVALGALFNTEIFAGRGSLRSETWIYAPDRTPRLPDDARMAIVRDRSVLTGRTVEPVEVYTHAWENALPVYGPPIARLQSALESCPRWLSLAGNYLGRLGVAHLVAAPERPGPEARRAG